MTKRITGTLTYEGADMGEAATAVADFAGRYRALGWDVDKVHVEVVIDNSKVEHDD